MPIAYVSTRGAAPKLGFEDVVLAGLASDGGLYVPESVPQFSAAEIASLAKLNYSELALRIVAPFIGDALTPVEQKSLIEKSYATFRHPAIAPLIQLDHNQFLLELFHGPTLAFKDFALQWLGNLLDHILKKRGQKAVVVGATSGDTGSAAIAGLRGRGNASIFILHPHGRVSDVQRRQMTTVEDANVHNIALKGTFDDCQDIVKALFADARFREQQKLVAVNSINWARILAQVVYYFYSACALGAPSRPVRFVVPTGNFGDIYAGYIAKRMGLPVEKLVIASNRNDILTRCVQGGSYAMEGVVPTLSPSMDIQVSSNFERLLFDLYNHDGERISALMQEFRKSRSITLEAGALKRLREEFAAHSADDVRTKATITDVYDHLRMLVDPHTAVGIAAARELPVDAGVPVITLSTAHPAKFPEAVKEATGVWPALPPHLSDIMEKEERYVEAENRVEAIKEEIVRAA